MEHDPYARVRMIVSRSRFRPWRGVAVKADIRTVRPDIAVRIPSRSDAYSLRHAPRNFQSNGLVMYLRNVWSSSPRPRSTAIRCRGTNSRGPRVPPCRAVQQPRPGRYPRPELYSGAAGFDHRPALHADLGHGGRRRDVRNGHVVVRPGASAPRSRWVTAPWAA